MTSIYHSADRVAAIIRHEMEKEQIGNDSSKVFLGGFSQGAQMTSYMQIAKLDFPLGGAMVLSGFPLPPLGQMPGSKPEDAKKKATYYGKDMRWFIWNGDKDWYFDANKTLTYYREIFETLGVSETVKVLHVEKGLIHWQSKEEWEQI